MKTIDRDALMELLYEKEADPSLDYNWLKYLGYSTAVRDVENFPTEERYTLQETARIFIEKARVEYSDIPDIGEWEMCLCSVVENAALEKE